MSHVRDVLHSEIDLAEDMQDRARSIVDRAWQSRFAEILALPEIQNIPDPVNRFVWALETMLVEIGHELDPLTTEAVRSFGRLGRQRRASVGDDQG